MRLHARWSTLLSPLSLGLLCCIVVVVAGCGGAPAPAPTATAVSFLAVKTTTDLGAIGAPSAVQARDGGASALLGGQVLWTFGDTLLNPAAADGAHLRTNTAALASPSAPLATNEPQDANHAPAHQFLPFTRDELAYNNAKNDPNNRYALWPTAIIAESAGHGLVYFTDELVKGNLKYTHQGIGIATVASGATTATRANGFLFGASEPSFGNAMVADGMVYLFGNARDSQTLVVARVPLASVRTRSAYRFWSGSGWESALDHAAPIFDGVPGAVSVSYNAYLKRYLAVNSGTIGSHPNAILMRTAAQPQGPWSTPVVAFSGQAPATGVDYAAIEHPELASEDGKTIVVSYFHPTGTLTGALQLVQVTFA